MSQVIVRRVEGSTDVSAMLALARRIHADDPVWVPPFDLVEARRLHPSRWDSPHGRLTVFVATIGRRMVGSMSCLIDDGYNQSKGEKVAWWGWYEAEDDPAITAALLDAVASRAGELGCDRLRGPRNFSRVDQVGLTVEGSDRLPPMLQGQHPAYYQAHIEAAGLSKHHDVLAYERSLFTSDGDPAPVPDSLSAKAQACDLPGLTIRPVGLLRLGRDLDDAYTVLNASYATVPDVSPMPRATFMALGRSFLLVADRELLQLAYIDGRPVAFTVCLPEINEALVHLRDGAAPLSWLHALRAARHIETGAFKLIGVLPELRGTGVHARMIIEVVEGLRRAGYRRVDGSVIDERNKPMRSVVEQAGLTVYKRYRFYGLEL